MAIHYSNTDHNGTELSIQTYPGSDQIRVALIPKNESGERVGAVYFMPWAEQLHFAYRLQDAKDVAESNDEYAESYRFLKAMIGVEPEGYSKDIATEYFRRAEAYFQKRHFPEDDHLAAEGKE